jgi:hypothetical protein
MAIDKAALEKANAAARKTEHIRDAILTAISLTVLIAVVAGVWWLFAG